MKKLLSKVFCLLVLFQAMSFAYSEDSAVVFDVNLIGGDEVYMGLFSDGEDFFACFYDGEKAELNYLACSSDEYNSLKKLAYECSLLMKSITNKYDYDNKKIYNKIMDKITSFGDLVSEDYDYVDELGFVKVNNYLSDSYFNNLLYSDNTSKSGNTKGKNKLSVWSFTDEIEDFLDAEDYGYCATHPEVEVEYTFIPTDQFPSSLDPVLARGTGTPDVFALEDAFVRKYVECGLLLPLDDLYEEVKDKMADYPMKVGSYNGHVYAMSWQVVPGAMFYRRSYAKKYWGTDDPVEVQKKVKDFDTFMTTARELNRISNGKCKMVSTSGDLFIPCKGARKKPWVVNDKLYIDPAMEDYMEMCKIIYDEELDGRTAQWAEGWYAGMNDKLVDEKGKPLEVMAYFLPMWGLHYILKIDARSTAGDWAMCAGPSSWRWGGTWIAAYKGTKNPEAAKEMIRYLTTDDRFLESMALASGDLVGNIKVQNKIKGRFSEPYLKGQNQYAMFCELSKTVDGSLTQGTDQMIEALFSEAVTAYAMGEMTKRQALNYFKERVSVVMGY